MISANPLLIEFEKRISGSGLVRGQVATVHHLFMRTEKPIGGNARV